MPDLPAGVPRDVPGLWEGHRRWLESRGIEIPRVAIHGGYGKNNLGDDAILEVLISRTLEHLPRARLTVVCHGPRVVAERYRHVEQLDACHFKSFAAARAIVRSHLYIIGGGGIINRINTYSGYRRLKALDPKGKFLFLAAAGAKLFGATTHFYAVGATSFPDPVVRWLARHTLGLADLVSVRDPLSLANLRQLGVERNVVQVLDPALSLRPASPEAARKVLARYGLAAAARDVVCVGFRYVCDGTTDNDEKVRRITALCRHLIDERGLGVLFLPASQHPTERFEDDLDLGRRVRAGLGGEPAFTLVEEYFHPALTMALFGEVGYSLQERLHALILSAMMETPFLAVAYDQKVTEFVRQIGQAHRLLSLEEFMQRTDFGWIDPSWRTRGRRKTAGTPGSPPPEPAVPGGGASA